MSGRHSHLGVQDPPAEKRKQIGCMSGFLQLVDRAQNIHKSGHKRITAVGTPNASPSRTSPKRSSTSAETIRKTHNRNTSPSPKITARPLEFKDVVREALNKDRSQKMLEPEQNAAASNITLSPRKSIEFANSRQTPGDIDSDEQSDMFSWNAGSAEKPTKPTPLTFFKDSPRFSCDGREISRTPTIDVNEDTVLRSSSLQIRDYSSSFYNLSPGPENPSRRSPGLVARLMGLDELPEFSLASPRYTGKTSDPVHKNTIASEKILMPGDEETMVTGKTRCDSADFTAMEKRQKLISELESCDRDLQALKKIVEALQAKECLKESRNFKCNAEKHEFSTKHPIKISSPNLSPYARIEREALPQKLGTQTRDNNRSYKRNETARINFCSDPTVLKSAEKKKERNGHQCMDLRSSGFGKYYRKKAGIDFRIQAKERTARSLNLKSSRVRRCLEFGGDSLSTGNIVSDKAELKMCYNVEEASEISSDVPEQPSPVSVLDGSFYNDEASPSPVLTKSILHFSEEEAQPGDVENINEDHKKQQVRIESETEEYCNDFCNIAPISPDSASNVSTGADSQPKSSPKHAGKHQTQAYVREIFKASGLLQKGIQSIAIKISSPYFSPPISITTFQHLEATENSILNSNSGVGLYRNANKTSQTSEVPFSEGILSTSRYRRLVFDALNEIITTKFANPAWKQACNCAKSGEQILNEVLAEMDRVSSPQLKGENEDVCEDLIKMIENGFEVQDWNSRDFEVECVVNDIERLLFRDLIDEFLFDVAAACKWQPSSVPGHHRIIRR